MRVRLGRTSELVLSLDLLEVLSVQGGLDLYPSTLGTNSPHPGPFLTVQIRWSSEVGRSPTFSEMLPILICWLDEKFVLRSSQCWVRSKRWSPERISSRVQA